MKIYAMAGIVAILAGCAPTATNESASEISVVGETPTTIVVGAPSGQSGQQQASLHASTHCAQTGRSANLTGVMTVEGVDWLSFLCR